MSADTEQPTGTPPPSKSLLRKVAIASSVGTTIEFYDFFIYATAAALVFPKVFFPALGTAAGTVASFATLAVAFVARPVGAIVFGHYGDRLGRKTSLVMTLLIMGLSTVLIGLLPGAATWGLAAPILLVVLRAGQGFAVGGEWGGAALLAVEHSPARSRGRLAVFPQLGPSLGYLFSTAVFLGATAIFGATSPAFLDYGWRIPFLLSLILIFVGLWVRLRVAETPEFERIRAAAAAKTDTSETPERSPFKDVITHQPRELLLAAGAITMQYGFFYMGTAYLTSYGTSRTGMNLSQPTVLVLGMVAAVFFGAATIAFGRASDRFGRRAVITAACVGGLVWSLLLFPVLGLGGPLAFAVGLVVLLVIFGINFGPVGAFLPELFRTRYRYTGAGLAFSLGGIIGGGVMPLLAPALFSAFGGTGVGVMLFVSAALSLVCIRLLPETKNGSLCDEPAPRPDAATSGSPS